MNILYILGNGSLHNNEELRYSLRSVEKNVTPSAVERSPSSVERSPSTPEARIIVVGDNPGFLSDKVEYHYVPDASSNKAYSIAKKIEWACKNVLQGDFLFMNDDFFFHKKIVPAAYPNYQMGPLKQSAPDRNYERLLLDTHNYLHTLGHTTLHFDVHTPIIYNTEKFLALSPHWEESKKRHFGLVVKSVYGNIYGLPHLPYIDCKLDQLKTYDDFKRIEATSCISCSDQGWRNGVADYLKLKFPNPSKFEI